MLAKGGSIGYWQGEIPKVLADIGACRPTLFCGVPRVFDRIYAGARFLGGSRGGVVRFEIMVSGARGTG